MKAIVRAGLVAGVVVLVAVGCAGGTDERSTVSAEPESTEAPADPRPTRPPRTTTTEAPTTTVPPTTATTDPPESAGQKNARQSAADYLDYMAFSHSGLVDQLEFEGFSTADATYGVDALTVDWNEQAALSAAEYLDYTSFSRSGLIDQLVFEGFSQAEAEYGVSTTGL